MLQYALILKTCICDRRAEGTNPADNLLLPDRFPEPWHHRRIAAKNRILQIRSVYSLKRRAEVSYKRAKSCGHQPTTGLADLMTATDAPELGKPISKLVHLTRWGQHSEYTRSILGITQLRKVLVGVKLGASSTIPALSLLKGSRYPLLSHSAWQYCGTIFEAVVVDVAICGGGCAANCPSERLNSLAFRRIGS